MSPLKWQVIKLPYHVFPCLSIYFIAETGKLLHFPFPYRFQSTRKKLTLPPCLIALSPFFSFPTEDLAFSPSLKDVSPVRGCARRLLSYPKHYSRVIEDNCSRCLYPCSPPCAPLSPVYSFSQILFPRESKSLTLYMQYPVTRLPLHPVLVDPLL